jgi:hypothetical protein
MRGQNHTHEKNAREASRRGTRYTMIHTANLGMARRYVPPGSSVCGLILEDEASILLTGHHREPPPATPIRAA